MGQAASQVPLLEETIQVQDFEKVRFVAVRDEIYKRYTDQQKAKDQVKKKKSFNSHL